MNVGSKVCDPSKTEVSVGAAGCFQCFYWSLGDFNTSSFSMNHNLTQQVDSGGAAFLFLTCSRRVMKH